MNGTPPIFDAYYYQHGCGAPYERNEAWLNFFAGIAKKIKSEINPRSALDAGCAMGFLVEGLRNEGIDAEGIDISEYAIQKAYDGIKPYVSVGSITDQLPKKYDLIISIEVVEHMDHDDANKAIENLCQYTEDILFSSTPFDFKEATHFNVQVPDFWVEQFARQGFFRDVDFDASFITPWAIRFRRVKEPVHRIVRDYDRKLWLVNKENFDLRSLVSEMRSQVSDLDQKLESREQKLQDFEQQIDRIRAEQNSLLANQKLEYERKIVLLENEQLESERKIHLLEDSQRELNSLLRDKTQWLADRDTFIKGILNSRSWKFIKFLQSIRLGLFPLNSRREKVILSIVRTFRAGTRRLFSPGNGVSQPQSNEWIADFATKNDARPQDTAQHQERVDVIICVHNALDDLKRCLESVVRFTTCPYNLIIVDDGSDEETRAYLDDFSKSQAALIITNQTARGYTSAANQGMAQSSADFIVLLNSDTIVTRHWLDRMLACARSSERVGLVGPLSNTASWQSIPQLFGDDGDWSENPLPENISVNEMGDMVALISGHAYPRLPFLNGFCLLIRREVIKDIGLFDEEAFGKGYGEENDFIIRARQKGWEAAVATDTFIYHAQSRSYGSERRRILAENANQVLVTRYGQQILSDGSEACRKDWTLEGMRARASVAFRRKFLLDDGMKRWEGKRLLFILPITEPGGGGHVVLQEAIAMQKMGVDVWLANIQAHKKIFEASFPDNPLPVIYLENPAEAFSIYKRFDAAVATVYHSVKWLEYASPPVIRGYYIQDFEPSFFDPASIEYEDALHSYDRFPDLVRITKTEWNRQLVREKTGEESVVVGPSLDIDLFRPLRRYDQIAGESPIRIAAMIRPSTPRRQPLFTLDILREVKQRMGNNVEIILFGCAKEELIKLMASQPFECSWAGILTRKQLPDFFNRIDIFADFSTYQAMGLTALEAMACGSAVIIPQNGGGTSFARHLDNSLIVDSRSSEACLTAIEKLLLDKELRLHIQRQAVLDVCAFPPEIAAYNALNVFFG